MIRSTSTVTDVVLRKFWSRIQIDEMNGCWLWKKLRSNVYDPKDYGHINITGKRYYAHHISWTLFRGPIPDGVFVLHRCDIRRCVNPEHLFLGTQKDNLVDMVEKGRHGRSILTKEQVLSIRSDIRLGKPIKLIASDHGVKRHNVYDIKYERKWTWLEG